MGLVSASDEKHSTFAFSESELAKKAPKAVQCQLSKDMEISM